MATEPVIGTTGSDSGTTALIGTDSKNILIGIGGNDYLDGGGGSDALMAGAGDDILIYDQVDYKVDGGTGFDTLRFLGTSQTLDLTGNKIVSQIEQIQLWGGGGHHLSFTAADVIRVADNDKLRIWGDSTNVINFNDSGWSFGGFTSGGLTIYKNGSAAVEMQLGLWVNGFSNNATIDFGPGFDNLVVEDESSPSLTATGGIIVNDPNGQNFLNTQVSAIRDANYKLPVGTLSLGTSSIPGVSTGTYTYNVSNASVQYLAQGEKKIETFVVTSIDGTTKQFQFEIQGTNDAPIRIGKIGDSVSGSVTEISDGQPGENTASTTITGSFTVRDADLSDTLYYWNDSSAVPIGSLTEVKLGDSDANGERVVSWTYVVNDAQLDSLRDGEKVPDTLSLKFSDRPQGTLGASVLSQDIMIDLVGSNDKAFINVSKPNDLIEDVTVDPNGKLISSGIIFVNDNDRNEGSLDLSNFNSAGPYGTLTLQPDTQTAGQYQYTYVVDNNAINSWNSSRTEIDKFTIKSIDGTTADLSFSIQGRNDPPTITGTTSVIINEAPAALNDDGQSPDISYTATFVLSIADVDNSIYSSPFSFLLIAVGDTIAATRSASTAFQNNQIVLTRSFVYNDSDLNSLKSGETIDLNYKLTVTDSLGAATSQVITVTINGADDPIMGTDANDTLQGTSGNDLISGLAGDDTLSGLAGDDYLHGGNGNDIMSGGDGADRLVGGMGADQMSGGSGDDQYYVDDPGDLVSESPGEGNDTVWSSITFTLSANVENLVLTGLGSIDGTGNDSANTITGNSGNNVIDGRGGNDDISGGGGIDKIFAGDGNDVINILPVPASEIQRGEFRGEAGNDLFKIDAAGYNLNLFGGDGIDRYVFRSTLKNNTGIVIKDFDIRNMSTGDKLDLSGAWTDYTLIQTGVDTYQLKFQGSDFCTITFLHALGYTPTMHDLIGQEFFV